MKAINYTKELTEQICNDYQNGKSVDEIANEISKSTRSVRSKLVREGGYVAKPKTSSSTKKDEPTKKQLVKDLEEKFSMPSDVSNGMMGATKTAIQFFLDN